MEKREIKLRGRSGTTYYWLRKVPSIQLTSLNICCWNRMCDCWGYL